MKLNNSHNSIQYSIKYSTKQLLKSIMFLIVVSNIQIICKNSFEIDPILPLTAFSNSFQTTCGLESINFSWRPQTSFSDFFDGVKNYITRLSRFEIKSMYKFLDSKSLGYFTNSRWSNFYNLFINPFILCDIDKNCLLNHEELKDCMKNGEEMKLIEDYLPEEYNTDYFITEIIFSLDSQRVGGINLSNYLFIKRILIGYRQFHISGYLDKDTFHSALKTTFVDKQIDDVDSEMAFRIALSLMFEGVKNDSLSFPQYFEICRLVNSFLSFGITIGEGFITNDGLKNMEGDRYPSKLNSDMYKKYFDLFAEDFNLNINSDTMKFDPKTLRFEDHATLEFWANIFTNYTDSAITTSAVNRTGFKDLILKNKFFRKKYYIYIAYSNFEDYNKINVTQIKASNITDYDFLTNFGTNFLETSIETLFKKNGFGNANNKADFMMKKNSLLKVNLKVNDKVNANLRKGGLSVFDTLHTFNKLKSKSLFDLKLNDDEDYKNTASNSDEHGNNQHTNLTALVESALQNYFTILDFNLNNYLTFEEFVIFLKYLRLFDRLNKDNSDKRGLLKSSCVNYINEYNIFPKLSVTEKIRLQNLDSLSCQTIDFLLFFDYMIGPKEFKHFLLSKSKNFVDEMHIMIAMKRLNLYADINQRLFEYKTGPLLNNYDYDSVLTIGLKNKCNSNFKLFNITNITKNITEYSQQLNSTIVDPSNIPRVYEDSPQGKLPDSHINSTMSGDNINLDPAIENGDGMDNSSEIINS